MVGILQGLYFCEPKIDTSDLMLEIVAKIAILAKSFRNETKHFFTEALINIL